MKPILCLLVWLLVSTEHGTAEPKDDNAAGLHLALSGKCFHSLLLSEWWGYVWCFKVGVVQFHLDHATRALESETRVGFYSEAESGSGHHVYRADSADCLSEQTGEYMLRYAEVSIDCCTEEQFAANAGRTVVDVDVEKERDNTNTFIAKVVEPVPCSYYISVCSRFACARESGDGIERHTEEDQQHSQNQRRNWRKQKIENYRASRREAKKTKGGGSAAPRREEPPPPPPQPPPKEQHQQPAPPPTARQQRQQRRHFQQPATPLLAPAPPPHHHHHHHHHRHHHHHHQQLQHNTPPTEEEQNSMKERVRVMFYHAYDSYMSFAFPEAELRPLSCEGGPFELVKIPMVTLIDTLDTLVVLGNHSEFRRAVRLVSSHYPSFDLDVNVSVFETTIRVLGGLLSAHLMAIDPLLQIYDQDKQGGTVDGGEYDGALLVLATDLGNRLLPAFRTNTGIPYGTVNLRSGVPRGETEIASTAGAGSLIVEFEALSSLTKDRRFGDAAYGATQALFDRRSPIGLLGKHIHTKTGRWFESVSGIGSNSDSFYEYLLKSFLLYRREKMFRMFTDTFAAIKRFVQVGNWFNDVDMFNGKVRRNRVENLAAFWPGLEASLGFSGDSSRQLNTLYAVWADLGFLPEEFDNVQWLGALGLGGSSRSAKAAQHINAFYPLRPELIESTYHQYRTTKDRSWLAAGLVFLESLENHTRTGCGHGSVTMMMGAGTVEVSDTMPSFFLSETCKYLFLLFDEGNFVHDRAYIFSTEAHLFDPLQLKVVVREEDGDEEGTAEIDNVDGHTAAAGDGDGDGGGGGGGHGDAASVARRRGGDLKQNRNSQRERERIQSEADDQEAATSGAEDDVLFIEQMKDLPLLPIQCVKAQWWDATHPYDANFIQREGLGGSRPGRPRSAFKPDSRKPRIRTTKTRKQPQPVPLSPSSNQGGGGAAISESQHRASHHSKWRSNLLREWASRSRASPLAQLLPFFGFGAGELSTDKDGAELLEEKDDEELGDAENRRQQLVVVDSLVRTARQMLQLGQRRDLSQLHVAMHGRPAVAPDLGTGGLDHRGRVGEGGGGGGEAIRFLLRRSDSCYPEDAPEGRSSRGAGNGGESNNPNTNSDGRTQPLQMVDVSMGVLGEYSVQVYSDGFIVHSKVWGDTLEISNVGQPVMFVRDSNADSVRTVIGSSDGRTVSCMVALVGPDAEAGEPPLWERACSIAAFGPVSLVEPLYAHLALDDSFVFAEAASSRGSVEGRQGSDVEVEVEDEDNGTEEEALGEGATLLAALDTLCQAPLSSDAAAAEPRRWWPWGGGNRNDEKRSDGKDRNNHKKSRLRGRVAIARRGDCMFEDKMQVAEASGSSALIVINDKDVLFLMSSKMPDESENSRPTDSTTSSSSSKVPTVMLTKSDGASLLAALQTLRRSSPDFVPRVRMSLTAQPMVLDVALLGAATYPKLRMRPNVIYVLGRGAWGAVLTSTTGLDWQLFIASKSELDGNFTPGTVLPDGDGGSLRARTFWAGFTTNPIELYSMILSRQCPTHVSVDESLAGDFGKANNDDSSTVVIRPRGG